MPLLAWRRCVLLKHVDRANFTGAAGALGVSGADDCRVAFKSHRRAERVTVGGAVLAGTAFHLGACIRGLLREFRKKTAAEADCRIMRNEPRDISPAVAVDRVACEEVGGAIFLIGVAHVRACGPDEQPIAVERYRAAKFGKLAAVAAAGAPDICELDRRGLPPGISTTAIALEQQNTPLVVIRFGNAYRKQIARQRDGGAKVG